MQPGFRNLPIDRDFAERSAHYLATRGYLPEQIRIVLVDELDLTAAAADTIVVALAA